MATEGVAMGQAIAVRADYTAGEVRRLAKRVKDVAQARRLLAIAAVLAGASHTEAAKIGGMDRQTLRDWVIRFAFASASNRPDAAFQST
jgi:transposase-like protein